MAIMKGRSIEDLYEYMDRHNPTIISKILLCRGFVAEKCGLFFSLSFHRTNSQWDMDEHGSDEMNEMIDAFSSTPLEDLLHFTRDTIIVDDDPMNTLIRDVFG